MTRKMYRFVFFLLSFQLCKAQVPDELTGGATGDNNNQFVDGTANTEKILLGVNCVADTETSTPVTLQLYVNQGDDAFKIEEFSTTVRANSLILYETCFFIDAAAYASASKTLTKASDCDNADFQTIDSTAGDTTFERRTKTAELVISNPAQESTYTCGARKNDDGDIEVAVYCKREEGFDKAFDVVFIAKYSPSQCTATMVTTNIRVTGAPIVEVYHNLQVQMKAYIQPDSDVDGPRSPDASEITSSIVLGTAMYLEICLIKPSENNNNHFLEDGISPISARPYLCTARPDLVNSDFQSSVDSNTEEPLTDENGCGAAQTGHKGIEEYFKPENYIFRFLTDQNEPNSYLLTPNCVRSDPFPAISFARLKAVDFVDTIFTCKLDYCTSSKDSNCFGPDGSGTDQYPTCPSNKRKRRETITVGPELPEELSVSVRVELPGMNATNSESNGCFEQTTFIGVTSAMGTVLLGVIVAAILLAVKLTSYAPESSTDSMTGIHNKAYY